MNEFLVTIISENYLSPPPYAAERTHACARGCCGRVRQRAFRRARRAPRTLRRRSQRTHASTTRRHATSPCRTPRARAVAETYHRDARQRWRQPLCEELRALMN